MKKLFIIRHAKSDLTNSNTSDFDRPLNHRGLRDSQKIGEHLNIHFAKPEIILTSPAKRALTTSHIIAEQINYSTDKIQKEDPLYLATLEDLIKQIQNLDNKCNVVYIFGHNPGVSSLVSYFTNEWIEMKTCCAAILEAEVDDWKAWIKGIALLKNYISPKNINKS